MDPATATTVLLVLGSAFGVMFTTMTTLLVVSIRVQHREGQETREYVALHVEKAIGALRPEFNERLDSRSNELMQVIEHNRGTPGDAMGALRLKFNERLDSRSNELMQVIEHNHQVYELRHETSENQHKATQKRLDRLEAGLDDVRERLARIEGHLGIGPHQPADHGDPGESNSDAA